MATRLIHPILFLTANLTGPSPDAPSPMFWGRHAPMQTDDAKDHDGDHNPGWGDDGNPHGWGHGNAPYGWGHGWGPGNVPHGWGHGGSGGHHDHGDPGGHDDHGDLGDEDKDKDKDKDKDTDKDEDEDEDDHGPGHDDHEIPCIVVGGHLALFDRAFIHADRTIAGYVAFSYDTVVDGDVGARGIKFDGRTTVKGDLTYAEYLLHPERAHVEGKTKKVPAIDVPGVHVPDAGHDLPKLGSRLHDHGSLPPGAYDDLILEDRATLSLASGTYAARRLVIGHDAVVHVNVASGPVWLFVDGQVDLADRAHVFVVHGDPKAFTIVSQEGVSLGYDAVVEGQIVAKGDVAARDRALLQSCIRTEGDIRLGYDVSLAGLD